MIAYSKLIILAIKNVNRLLTIIGAAFSGMVISKL